MRDAHGSPCAQVDHGYAQVTITWCPHRHGWTATLSRWVEPGTAQVDHYFTRSVRLGFPSFHADLIDALEPALYELMLDLVAADPPEGTPVRLPGFGDDLVDGLFT